MKNKILYLIPHLQNQGPVMQLYSLIAHINSVQYEPIIATVFPERDNSMLKAFIDLGIEVECGDCKKWNILDQTNYIKRLIKSIKPDIIHSCSTITDCICSSINIKKPLIITLHNYVYEDVMVHYGKIIGTFLCNKEKKAILKADSVIPCSETLCIQYSKLIARSYDPIPNGIEIEKWKNDHITSLDSLRNSLNLPTDKYIYISTGALIERKNPLIVIEAFKNANVDNSILLILGDGNLSEQCKSIANNNVIFTGRVKNVKDYLYASDVLISASRAEGLPYAILEAECTGIRMILSDIPQHKEALKGNSSLVSFFPVDNISELEKYIKAENEKGKGRVKYDTDSISAEKMAEKYMNIYHKLIAV